MKSIDSIQRAERIRRRLRIADFGLRNFNLRSAIRNPHWIAPLLVVCFFIPGQRCFGQAASFDWHMALNNPPAWMLASVSSGNSLNFSVEAINRPIVLQTLSATLLDYPAAAGPDIGPAVSLQSLVDPNVLSLSVMQDPAIQALYAAGDLHMNQMQESAVPIDASVPAIPNQSHWVAWSIEIPESLPPAIGGLILSGGMFSPGSQADVQVLDVTHAELRDPLAPMDVDIDASPALLGELGTEPSELRNASLASVIMPQMDDQPEPTHSEVTLHTFVPEPLAIWLLSGLGVMVMRLGPRTGGH